MDLLVVLDRPSLYGACVDGGTLVHRFRLPAQEEALRSELSSLTIHRALVCSESNETAGAFAGFPLLDPKTVKLKIEGDAPLSSARIARLYGALMHYPQNDCIVLNVRKELTFDCLDKQGHCIGGAVYPGPDTLLERPESPLSGGLYWGLLGAIERIISELRQVNPSPSSVKVVASGAMTQSFSEDLSELVDLIDPALTLIGLQEILKGETNVT